MVSEVGTRVTGQQVRELRPQGSQHCAGGTCNRGALWKPPGICRAAQSHVCCEHLRAGLSTPPLWWRGEGVLGNRVRRMSAPPSGWRGRRGSILGVEPGQDVGHTSGNNGGHRWMHPRRGAAFQKAGAPHSSLSCSGSRICGAASWVDLNPALHSLAVVIGKWQICPLSQSSHLSVEDC